MSKLESLCTLSLEGLPHLFRSLLLALDEQVPIVASTGGLVDTVKDGETGFQIGEFNVDVSLAASSCLVLLQLLWTSANAQVRLHPSNVNTSR